MSQEFFAAVHDNDQKRVEQLLNSDPSLISARNANGVSALMQARYEGRHEIVDLLRGRGIDLDVFEAATLGDVDQLRKLLSAEPSLTKAYSADGFTALHLAAFFGQPDAAEELLQAGAAPDAVS